MTLMEETMRQVEIDYSSGPLVATSFPGGAREPLEQSPG